jgi:hypothetical protein
MGRRRPAVTVESTLERDFVLLQRFDREVAAIEEQPVRILYRSVSGRMRSYIPDFLVSYRNPDRAALLVEVKHSRDRALLSGALEERFAAARRYAEVHGWSFVMMTEADIRTPRLQNATFLLPFRERGPEPSICRELLRAIGAHRVKTVQSVADAVARSFGVDRSQVLPSLWALIAELRVVADVDRPLTMQTSLSLPEGVL